MDENKITWREFKEFVESAGVRDDEWMAWIDWQGTRSVKIQRYPNGDVKIADGDFLTSGE